LSLNAPSHLSFSMSMVCLFLYLIKCFFSRCHWNFCDCSSGCFNSMRPYFSLVSTSLPEVSNRNGIAVGVIGLPFAT
jgi:hypothetical protein